MRAPRKHALFQLIFGVAAVWQAASASEFECRNGAQTRRVEVRSGDAVENLACEVRYWRDATARGTGEVLWRANQDADFCDAKAAVLLGRLEAGGWRCATTDQPTPSAPGEAAAPAADAPLPAPEPPIQEAASPDAPTPDPTPQAELPAASEPGAGPAEEGSAPAILEQVVAQTLRNVQQMYGGEFHADGTVLGDLDGDDRADAAVLVTYQAGRDDYVQYLVAYLFDGETFHSTATKNVGGRFLDALHAELRGIVDRAIIVDLQALDQDADCCDTRRTAFALQDGELIEVGDSAGAPERRIPQGTASQG